MQTQIITPDARDWQNFLEQLPHDIYHKAEYVRLCANHDGGRPVAFVATEGNSLFFVPLLLRSISAVDEPTEGLCDASSPYGYPCPLSNSSDEGFWSRALQQMVSNLREIGVVSTFLRLHPLLGSSLEALRQIGTVVQHGQTVYMDLTQSEEELWRQTRRTHRRHVKRATEDGYSAEIDHSWSCFEEFFNIYTETMERVSADDYYLFSRQYLSELRDALKDDLHLGVVRLGDSVACAHLYTEVGGIVQSYLGGARSAYNQHAPTILLHHFVRSWAKKRGNHTLHLGGGKGGSNSDSLFHFKTGFSELRSDFYTWRAVLDVDRYQTLASPWERTGGVEDDDLNGFFPVYRRPLSDLAQLTGASVRENMAEKRRGAT